MLIPAALSAVGIKRPNGRGGGVDRRGEGGDWRCVWGLKALITDTFGAGNAVSEAAERLEAKPDSEGRKREVAEAVAESGAAERADIVAAAEALLAKLKATPAGAQHIQSAAGSYIAQAAGGSTAKVIVNRRDD